MVLCFLLFNFTNMIYARLRKDEESCNGIWINFDAEESAYLSLIDEFEKDRNFFL